MASPDIPVLAETLKSRLLPWAKTNLGILSEFYADGQWHIGDENTAWYLNPCFSALAATMYRYDPTLVKYKEIAIDSVEAGFTGNLNAAAITTPRYTYTPTPGYPNTLFTGLSASPKPIASFDSGPWGCPDATGSDDNGTIEAGATFCWILDMLYFGPDGKTPSGALSEAQALDWITKLKTAADWLIDWNGNPLWYTNGNYVAHQCLFYAHLALLCRKILKDEPGWLRYSQAYEQTIQTLIYPFGNNAPANAQWANYGYTYTVAGSETTGGVPAILKVGGCVSDGSTETGHLTETPSHSVITPGVTNTFDGAYSQLTLDLLCTLYVVNRDWRINYLMNALWNKLETITDFSTYLIDCTGGSRQGGIRGWTGGYQNIIAMIGRRTSNRTNITNAVCLGAWDNQVSTGIVNNIAINQIQSSQARLFRINIASTLHCCYLVDKRLT